MKRHTCALALTTLLLAAPTGAQQGSQGFRRPQNAHNVLWSGDVDGIVEVQFRKREAKVHRIEGKGIEHEQAFFRSPLPEKFQTVSILTLQGRGRVILFQHPASSNRYTAAIRIEDTAPGRSHYRIQLSWP